MEAGQPTLFINCDEPDLKLMLENVTSTQLRSLIGNNTLFMIDEAQKVIKQMSHLLAANLNSIYTQFLPMSYYCTMAEQKDENCWKSV